MTVVASRQLVAQNLMTVVASRQIVAQDLKAVVASRQIVAQDLKAVVAWQATTNYCICTGCEIFRRDTISPDVSVPLFRDMDAISRYIVSCDNVRYRIYYHVLVPGHTAAVIHYYRK